ncbi:hypothetical protein BX600DRAFT_472103 [Xylariales sp. PMI_506]|nr:hypothetical protein BX600DRAFT_472103 [Xylariales sp. PMI_506]
MAARIPCRPTASCLSLSSLTPQTAAPSSVAGRTQSQFQTRNATLIRRPRRAYTFTQLVQLSDGSTYTMRTTSPLAMYKSTKDTRNHILWNPSEKALRNVEVDEAGKLAAFRERFGRTWDAPAGPVEPNAEDVAAKAGSSSKPKPEEPAAEAPQDDAYDPLGDLISKYAVEDQYAPSKTPKAVKGKKR